MGNRPIRWRFANKTAHWDPRGTRRVCHRHRAVKSVGVAIRARICAILLGRPLLGRTCQIPWGSSVGELERRAAGIGPLSLASGAFVCFLGSACLSGLNLCHTDSSCSGRLGVGDDDCFGAVAWKRSGLSRQLTEYSLQASQTSQPAWPGSSGCTTMVRDYPVRLSRISPPECVVQHPDGPRRKRSSFARKHMKSTCRATESLGHDWQCIAARLAHRSSRSRSLRVAVTESVLLHIVRGGFRGRGPAWRS